MVPINHEKTTLDLIKYLNIPTIVVVKNELGCVSSTLTTILAFRSKNIEIAGVILNGEDDSFNNLKAIEYYSAITVLDKIKKIELLNKNSILNYRLNEKVLKLI